ncbi:MAG: type II and III secretion system protein family protein [Blastocatellia bacterium]
MNNPFPSRQPAHGVMAAPRRPQDRPAIFSPGMLLSMLFAMAGLVAAAQDRPTVAVSFARDTDQPVKIDLLVGQARVIEFDKPFRTVSISDETIVDTPGPLSRTPKTLVLNGRKFGQINVIIWAQTADNEPEKMIVLDVYVQNNLNLADNNIKILFPKENIQLSQANGAVVISGTVTRPEIAQQVEAILKAAGYTAVVNMIKPPLVEELQVQLQVRVAEVNRQLLREIGAAYGGLGLGVPTYVNPGGPAAFGSYNQTAGGNALSVLGSSALTLFFGANGNVNNFFIKALTDRGALRTLAEPNLTARNGKPASFIAGGEYPIPTVQSAGSGLSGINIQFKPYGVQINFTPTIKDENHIQLDLKSEVSALDFGNAVRLSDTFIPALRVRRAETSIELRDGQSFALAGLLDNTETVNLSKIPGIGDIPLIGELFKSRRFQKNETELLFLCTVKLVEPLNPDQIPSLPGILPGQGTPASGSAPIEGDSGHAPAQRKISELQTPPQPLRDGEPVPMRIDNNRAKKP